MQSTFPPGYRVVKKLGRGCFGEVYLAKDIASGNEFAVKVINQRSLTPTLETCLTREVRTLSALSSPYIVSLHETCQSNDYFFLVMEYCAGMNLQDYMSSVKGPVEEPLVRRWAEQLVEGLKEMRTKKVIHRDLKLANVMLSDGAIENTTAKICDFGFSRFLESGQNAETVLGTPISTAPEVIIGEPYNHKADVWSLGCMLYELLTNRRPFPVKNLQDLIDMQKEPIKFTGKVSLKARSLILHMMSYDPRKRPDVDVILSHPFFKEPPELDINNGATGIKSFNIQLEETIAYIESNREKNRRALNSLLSYFWKKLQKFSRNQDQIVKAQYENLVERMWKKLEELKSVWDIFDSDALEKEAEAKLLRCSFVPSEQDLHDVKVLLEPCSSSPLADECRDYCFSCQPR